MSSGIVLMNKKAVAIAIDSATTIGNRSAIYTHGEKIFTIGDNLPVVFAISGNVNFLNVPVGLIIESFSAYLSESKMQYDSLFEYGEKLIFYLKKSRKEFKFEEVQNSYLDQLFYNILYDIFKTMDKYFDPNQSIDSLIDYSKDDILELNKDAINNGENVIKDLLKVDEILDKEAGFIKDSFEENYNYLARNSQFELTEADKAKFFQAFIEIFKATGNLEYYSRLNQDTVITITGFGKENVFPAVHQISLFGMYENTVSYYENRRFEISFAYPREIHRIAQSSVIDSIIDGINSKLGRSLHKEYMKRFYDILSHVLEKDVNTISKITDELDKIQYSDLIIDISRDNWGPIFKAVEFLPELDMAMLANNLINITSVLSNIKLDDELNSTVGGETKVLTITKFNGVVWR
jgi:hypothetical protein